MTVRQFIIENGIEALNGKKVIKGGIEYRIKLSEHDRELHSVEDEYWQRYGNPQQRFDRFHEKGTYRMCASVTDERGKNYTVFVCPSTELVEETKLPTYKEQLAQLITGLRQTEAFIKNVEQITGCEHPRIRLELWEAYGMASAQLKEDYPQEYIQHQKDMALVYANNAEYFDKLKVTFNKS